MHDAIEEIKQELDERIKYFKDRDMLIEAQRIAQRTNYDIEMLEEVGFCSGIENYSRHLTGRKPGEPPFTLVNYFPKDFLTVSTQETEQERKLLLITASVCRRLSTTDLCGLMSFTVMLIR